MAGTNMSPGEWSWTATTGDSLTPTDFTITADGSPLTFTTAVAQIRSDRSTASTLVLELSVDIASNVVTVGDGDDLDGITPGVYWWSLEGTNTDYPSGLTVVAGTFEVLDDGTEVVVP